VSLKTAGQKTNNSETLYVEWTNRKVETCKPTPIQRWHNRDVIKNSATEMTTPMITVSLKWLNTSLSYVYIKYA